MRLSPVLPLALLLALSLPGAAAAQEPAPGSPCADSLYQALRTRPLDRLSEREYEYFVQRDRGCVEYQALRSLVERPAPAPARRIPTRTRSQGNSFGNGADVFVANDSDEPILVNSVRVYDCANLRQSSCGIHHPKVRIGPRQERRVLTIRYSSPDLPSSYRYEYHVAPSRP